MIQSRLLQGLAIAAVACLSVALDVVGFNLYEPYLTAVRAWAHGLVFVVSAAMLVALWRHGRRTGRHAVHRLLLALWCLPPVAITTADVTFAMDKNTVVHTGGADARDLGRHFIVGYVQVDDVAPLASRGLIGGIYITRHNISGRTAADLKSEIASLQELRKAAGLPPLIVAADQEGGIVSHLSPQLTPMPALSTLAQLAPDTRAALAREIGEIQGHELATLGVTMNFAPVVDLRIAARQKHVDLNSLIGRRAISDDPAVVTEVASPYIGGLAAYHVAATLKHFPGLGRADDDTHLFSAHIDAPLAELQASDWRPFRALLSQTGASLMVGHATVTAIDPDRPASLSKRLIDGEIRGVWGYDGLVVTDDMVMGAVYRNGICTASVEALNAGVDLVLIAFDGAQYYRMFACALAAKKRGEIDAAMMRASATRLEHGAMR